MMYNEVFSHYTNGADLQVLADRLNDDQVIVSCTQTSGAYAGAVVDIALDVYAAKNLATAILCNELSESAEARRANHNFEMGSQIPTPLPVYEFVSEDGCELRIYHCGTQAWAVALRNSDLEMSVTLNHKEFRRWGHSLDFAVGAWVANRYAAFCTRPA